MPRINKTGQYPVGGENSPPQSPGLDTELVPRQEVRSSAVVSWSVLALKVGLPLAALLAVALIGLSSHTRPVAPRLADDRPTITPPVEQVRLVDTPGRPWKSYAATYRDWLGQPLSNEHPFETHASCVTFEYYAVCVAASPKTEGLRSHFEPLLLGEGNLPNGTVRQVDAPLAPIVQAYISRLEQNGDDWFYWLGRVIAPASCLTGDGECSQVFQRQVLHWAKGATSPEAVYLTALGKQRRNH